jgi:hypothetical protein
MITVIDTPIIALSFTSFWHLLFYLCLFIAALPLIALVIKFLWNQLPSIDPTMAMESDEDYLSRITQRRTQRTGRITSSTREHAPRPPIAEPRPVKQKADRIKCEYCGQANKRDRLQCKHCGAGLAVTA